MTSDIDTEAQGTDNLVNSRHSDGCPLDHGGRRERHSRSQARGLEPCLAR